MFISEIIWFSSASGNTISIYLMSYLVHIQKVTTMAWTKAQCVRS